MYVNLGGGAQSNDLPSLEERIKALEANSGSHKLKVLKTIEVPGQIFYGSSSSWKELVDIFTFTKDFLEEMTKYKNIYIQIKNFSSTGYLYCSGDGNIYNQSQLMVSFKDRNGNFGSDEDSLIKMTNGVTYRDRDNHPVWDMLKKFNPNLLIDIGSYQYESNGSYHFTNKILNTELSICKAAKLQASNTTQDSYLKYSNYTILFLGEPYFPIEDTI